MWTSGSDISVGDLLDLLWRRAPTIVACLCLGVFVALLVTPSVERGFRSEAAVLVEISATDDLTEALQAARLSDAALDTYIELATSDLVLQRIADTTSLDRTTDEIRASVSARRRAGTLLVEIGAFDADRSVAVQLAAAASGAFIEVVDDLAVRNGLEPRSVIIDEASDARRAVSHDRDRDIVTGAGLGLMAGAIVALGQEALDSRVRTRGDVTSAVGSCLGAAPRDVRDVMPELVGAIRFATGRSVRSLAVVSPNGVEGKTMMVTELARAYAAAGRPTVVVDASLNGTLTTATAAVGRQGLGDVLRGHADVRDCLVPVESGVWLVPTGEDLDRVPHLLESERMRNALWLLDLEVGSVIIDTSAFETTTTGYGLSTLVDGVVLLARTGVTGVEEVGRVASRLVRVGAPLLGGVLVARHPRPGAPMSAASEGSLRGSR